VADRGCSGVRQSRGPGGDDGRAAGAAYHLPVETPREGDNWLALSDDRLPVDEAQLWAVRPDCGAVVVFVGTVRDHAEGRSGVTALEYEAYTEQAIPRMEVVAAETRARWPQVGRLAILHRVGPLSLTDAAVVVVVSAPHRDEAFAAARFCIDTVKATVPIWKKETWDDGIGWGTGAQHISSLGTSQ
jgi:molybdopterin synthase catalytic subunit